MPEVKRSANKCMYSSQGLLSNRPQRVDQGHGYVARAAMFCSIDENLMTLHYTLLMPVNANKRQNLLMVSSYYL